MMLINTTTSKLERLVAGNNFYPSLIFFSESVFANRWLLGYNNQLTVLSVWGM